MLKSIVILESSLDDSHADSLDDSLGDSLDDSLGNSLGKSLDLDKVDNLLDDTEGYLMGYEKANVMCDWFGESMWDVLGKLLGDAHDNILRNILGDEWICDPLKKLTEKYTAQLN